ncbi:hypothetical protein ACIQHU_39415 [Streptomyces tendae]|uniref:hypothetical protein n=1 Tax=Streptomyces tendae TaxID=1932 RepID=UPI00381BD918
MTPSPQYPYQDGDVTVLGPEIFASKDDTVISWRGENYVRQSTVGNSSPDLTSDALYELCSAVRDLASAVRLETVDRSSEVTVHVGNQEIGDAVRADVSREMVRITRIQRDGA